jgi:hypothetical protein
MAFFPHARFIATMALTLCHPALQAQLLEYTYTRRFGVSLQMDW